MYNTKVFESFGSEEFIDNLVQLRQFYREHKYFDVAQISKGEHLKIALLDSGIDMLHEKLASRFISGYNAYKDTEEYLDDVDGHGTFMTGLITGKTFGLLPNATLMPVRVCSDDKKINLSSLVRGIQWAIEQEVQIIVMAITTKTHYPALQEAIKMAYDKNIIVICSACNDNSEIGYPAKYPETLTVTGTDYKQGLPDFAANDVSIDLVMPSVDIPSTYYYNRYALASGNSVAAALAVTYIGLVQNLRKKLNDCYFNTEQLRTFLKLNHAPIDIFDVGIPTFKNFEHYEYKFDNIGKSSY